MPIKTPVRFEDGCLFDADGKAVVTFFDNDYPASEDVHHAAEIVAAVNGRGGLVELLDHPLLRDIFAAIEDSGPASSMGRLWPLVTGWTELRDIALAASTPTPPRT